MCVPNSHTHTQKKKIDKNKNVDLPSLSERIPSKQSGPYWIRTTLVI